MRVQTQQIEFIGFERIQEILMRMKLSEVSLPAGKISIELEQSVEYGRCDYCWYGGLMATVKNNDNEFTVVANGDVVASLIEKLTNEQLAYVKDKSNSGGFYSEMCVFIKNDAHLYEIMDDKDPRFSLNFENNNWYEIFWEKINGDTTDDSYVSDATNIFDAISEGIELLKEEILQH